MNKEDVAARVQSVLPSEHPDRQKTVDQLVASWFVSRRTARGLQLSEAGNSAFLAAEIEYADRRVEYSVRLALIHATTLLELSRKIPCPYWITTIKVENENAITIAPGYKVIEEVPAVRFYDTRIVSWIDLMGGLTAYLDSVDGYLPKS